MSIAGEGGEGVVAARLRDWTGGVGPEVSRRRAQDVPCHRFLGDD